MADKNLITKTYSYADVGVAPSAITLATVDLAGDGYAGPEKFSTVIKVEFVWGKSGATDTYLSSELVVVMNPIGGGGYGVWVPIGVSGYPVYPISNASEINLYSHLLCPDDPDVFDYFKITFNNLAPHSTLADYWQIDVDATLPNYTGNVGALITTYYPSHVPSNHDY